MKNLEEMDFMGKKVLLRCGFDVMLDEGKVIDGSRILSGLKTISYLRKQNPSLLLITSHMGRPGGKFDSAFSNASIIKYLNKLLGVQIELVSTLKELEEIKSRSDLGAKNIFMLENLRFWAEEEAGDKSFAKQVASGFDVYVNDAFSVCHRAHASLVGFPEFTKEKCAGFLLEEEYENLKKVKNEPDHPAVLVIGGAKIETKLPVINFMIDKYDKILVGGKIANEAIDQGINLGEKVILPVDFAPAGKEKERLDIGVKTSYIFTKEIDQAATIVWNGPMGKFEEYDCANGTKEILRAIVERKEKALTVLGGGETVTVVNKFGSINDFDYVSMSGGAMLEFLSGKELPGLKALE